VKKIRKTIKTNPLQNNKKLFNIRSCSFVFKLDDITHILDFR